VCQKSLKDAAILHRGQSCGRTAARSSGAPYWLAMAAVGGEGAAQRGIECAPSSVRVRVRVQVQVQVQVRVLGGGR
jgi:hypothetical protein